MFRSTLVFLAVLSLGSSSAADPSKTPMSEDAHPCDNVPGSLDTWLTQAQRETVVIVGGGVSGLNAMKTFSEAGFTDLVLLEAQDRVGGRVKTTRTNGVITEDGAEWIHGDSKNVLYHVAQMLGQVVPAIQPEDLDMRFESITGAYVNKSHYQDLLDLWHSTSTTSVLVPYYDRAYGDFYMDRFPEVYGPGYDSKEGEAWLRFFENLVCDFEGTGSWMDVSAECADHFESFGTDNQWTNGYDAIVDFLLRNVPKEKIHLSTPVCKIYWDLAGTLWNASPFPFARPSGYEWRAEDAALVVTADGSSYLTRTVLVTASLGHLKERHEKLFVPKLPQWKIDVFDGMDLGVANKIQIGFPERFWGPKHIKINLFWDELILPQEMAWLYGCYAIFSVRGPAAVLQVFVTGERSKCMESLPEETVEEHMLYFMRMVFDEEVPEPNFFRRTQWHKNIWTRGSYESYITMEGNARGVHNHEPVKEPHVDSLGRTTISFAGEYTSTIRFGTVDAALVSGVEQATNIMKELGV